MMEYKGYRIFLSYCNADKQIKNKLVSFLNPLIDDYKNRGITVSIWDMETDCADVFDANRTGGYIHELKQSHIIIPIITPNATDESKGIKRMTDEVRVARDSYGDNLIQVVPFVIGTRIENTHFETSLCGYSCAFWAVGCDNVNDIPESAFEGVIGKVKTLLDGRIKGNIIRQVPSNNIEGTMNCQTDCFCVGRDRKIKEIDEKFKVTNVVVLYGEGGMGKTTLAKNYIQTHLNEGVTYYFKECESVRDFITNLVFEDKKGLYDNSNPEEKYRMNRDKLKELDDKYIFIIDGYDVGLDDDECLIDEIRNQMACKFIITSRPKPTEIEFVAVDELDDDSLLKIVYRLNEDFIGNEEIESKLVDLFELVGHHTLTVELAAALMSYGDYTADEVYNKLFKATDKIKSRGHMATVNTHLITLFGMANLDDMHLEVMQVLSMFPSVGIKRIDLQKLLKLDNNDIINSLIGKALVRYDISHRVCSLHKMISNIVYTDYCPTQKQVDLVSTYWFQLCDKQKNDFSVTEYCLRIGTFFVEERHKSFDDSTNAAILLNCGLFNGCLGKLHIALEYSRKALDMFHACYGEKTNHPDIAKSLNNIGLYYAQLGDYEKSLEYSRKTLDMYYACYGENKNHPDFAMPLRNIGCNYIILGNYKEGLKYSLKALNMCYACYGEKTNHPDIALSLANTGLCYLNLGDYEKALEYSPKALNMCYICYGKNKNHPSTASALASMGFCCIQLGDYEKSLEYSRKALNMYYACYGENKNHPNIAMTLVNIGVCYIRSDDYEKALEYSQKALDIYYVCYGENTNHPQIANLLKIIGLCYYDLGSYERTLEHSLKALNMFYACYGESTNNPDIADLMKDMGDCYYQLDDSEKALEYSLKALNMYYACYGENTNNPDIAELLQNIGYYYSDLDEDLDNYEKALEYFLKSAVIYKNLNMRDNLVEVYRYIAECYEELNDEVKSADYINMAKKIREEG